MVTISDETGKFGDFKPRNSQSPMGECLRKREIHHICLHMGQDELEPLYRFKEQGLKYHETGIFRQIFSGIG
jgi:hypothetical protein